MELVACGGFHSLLVDRDGIAWVSGKNNIGQLGLGDTKDRHKFEVIPDLPQIIAVAAGLLHSYFLTASGDVWAAGDNEYGQLGVGSGVPSAYHPVMINFQHKIIKMACGEYHAVFLDEHGVVWRVGKLSHFPVTYIPELFANDIGKIVDVSHSESFMYCVNEANHFFCSGKDEYEKFKRYIWVPFSLTNGDVARKKVIGGKQEFFLREDGSVSIQVSKFYGFIKVEKDIIDIGAQGCMYLMLTDERKVRCIGNNYNHRHFKDTRISSTCELSYHGTRDVLEFNYLPPIRFFASGAAASSHHLMVDMEGKLWGWGRNEFGELGDVKRTNGLLQLFLACLQSSHQKYQI